MNEIKKHYDDVLREAYTWMFGDFDAKLNQNEQLFDELNLQPAKNGLAVDIGCGSGFQTIPLLNRGYSVAACDMSEFLLEELRTRTQSERLQTHIADALEFIESLDKKAELIVCMGDTITHFPSFEYVSSFIRSAHRTLSTDGKLIMTLRDYSNELTGADCVIPVRLTDERMLTCVLEYGEDKLTVTDVVYERENDNWQTRKNSYTKLRLKSNWLENELKKAGFTLNRSDKVQGMLIIVAVKS